MFAQITSSLKQKKRFDLWIIQNPTTEVEKNLKAYITGVSNSFALCIDKSWDLKYKDTKGSGKTKNFARILT